MQPVIKPQEFSKRRQKLMDLMGKNSIAIIPSSHEIIRSRDTHCSFRQDGEVW